MTTVSLTVSPAIVGAADRHPGGNLRRRALAGGTVPCSLKAHRLSPKDEL